MTAHTPMPLYAGMVALLVIFFAVSFGILFSFIRYKVSKHRLVRLFFHISACSLPAVAIQRSSGRSSMVLLVAWCPGGVVEPGRYQAGMGVEATRVLIGQQGSQMRTPSS